MGYLTGHNAPLINQVYKNYTIKSEIDLVSNGFYRSSAWKPLIGNNIPDGFTKDEYAALLANQIKLSYPTAVTADLVKNNSLLANGAYSKEELTNFLNLKATTYRIGTEPLKSWEGFELLSPEVQSAAKTIERLYQITPSDESMIALSNSGFTSAYKITKYSQKKFVAAVQEQFPSKQEAELVFKKAQEVFSTTLGIATGYLTGKSIPDVYALTGEKSSEEMQITSVENLEELLKNMDYCDCDHCKSVLSPAAYFVELLEFIDLEGVPYEKSNPVQILKKRRPDIENIQLSCENTNVALPYIDLVNEILEHYIVNDNLDNLMGHDVAEGTSAAELMAEPKYVSTAAYDLLKDKVFPYSLPFNQPLEMLRKLFAVWDTSLAKLLSMLSSGSASRMETLGCNEEEYKTLTDLSYKKLPEYFGEPENNTISQLNDSIANGKSFCRRVNISYEKLVSLLKTHFINPGIVLVPKVHQLKVSIEDIQRFYDGVHTEADIIDLISEGINEDEYENSVTQWLTNHESLIMELITLTDVGDKPEVCDSASVELRFTQPDQSSNQLTALEYHKFHRFLKLLHITGLPVHMLDNILKVLSPVPFEEIGMSNIDSVFVQMLDRLANFFKIASLIGFSEKKYPELLAILDTANDQDLRERECARILKISIAELNELMEFTRLDPLADDVEADAPSLMKIIEVSQRLKAASLKIVDLTYILRHNDLLGKFERSEETKLRDVKIILDAINAVESEYKQSRDSVDITSAKNKMQLVYDQKITDLFFGLLNNTETLTAPFLTTEEFLPDKLSQPNDRLGYDPFRKVLTFSGIITATEKTALENAADSLVLSDIDIITAQPDLDNFITDFKSSVNQIFNSGVSLLNELETEYPELKFIYDTATIETDPAFKLSKLVELLLPELTERLKLNAIRQSLTGILKTDALVVDVLTSGEGVMESLADSSKGIVHDFRSLEGHLLFNSNQTYQFYFDPPSSDEYILYLQAPENTSVTFTVNGETIIPSTSVGSSNEVRNTSPLVLTGGEFVLAELTISSLPAGEELQIFWRTKGMEKQAIASTNMIYVEDVVNAVDSISRLMKASQLNNLLKLSSRELLYFAIENTETQNFLNLIAYDNSMTEAELADLWAVVELLARFKILKEKYEPDENLFLQILKDPDVKNTQGRYLFEYINLWKEPDVAALLSHSGFVRDDLSRVIVIESIFTFMEELKKINYPVASVLTWITNDPGYSLISEIKESIKLKVTNAVWLETMQSVNDPVRNILRDALVDYILEYQRPSSEITDSNKLYEYFLIDVEMDACMKTSRIRQALSTVQLFIQRCLMNLEPDVDPGSIREDHWEWMKRYRVWEANRKVFLYPENWLEPELRDNKSYLFQELEGELLQSEVTDESAESALLNYLKKLNDISRPRIVGSYLEEKPFGNQDEDVLHIIGVTGGRNRQYLYRKYEYGYWTPWEKITLNIEGEHVYPVIWNSQLFIFWLNIFEKPAGGDPTNNFNTVAGSEWGEEVRVNVEVNISWGEYYKGKWTSPQSTEMSRPITFEDMGRYYDKMIKLFSRISKESVTAGPPRERLVLYLTYDGEATNKEVVITFHNKNSLPIIEYNKDNSLESLKKFNIKTYNSAYDESGTVVYSGPYTRYYSNSFRVNIGQPYSTSSENKEILSKTSEGFEVHHARYNKSNRFESPLFYYDENGTFYVEPTERKYTPLPEIQIYYPVYEVPVKYPEIPELIEKPIPGWPKEEIIQFEEEQFSNPWNWSEADYRMNRNFDKLLPVTDTFIFDGAEFDTGGKINTLSGK